jgi:peptidoglycan/LPS O-acetylase OafA/YrhL
LKKIAPINGLRGLAILGVIYFHLAGTFINRPGFHSSSFGNLVFFPYTFLSNGWLGVNLFFILSGFVLYLPYAHGNRKIHNFTDVWGFYKARFLRLMPLYYFTIAVGYILISRNADIYNPDFHKNLLILLTASFNFWQDTFIPQLNYVLWSLGVEIWFSVLFPVLIIAIDKIGFRPVLFLSLLVSLYFRYLGVIHPEKFLAPFLNMYKDGLFGRLDDFVIGMFIADLFVKGYAEDIFKPLARFWLVMGVVLTFFAFNFSDYVYLGWVGKWGEVFVNTFIQLGFGLLTIAALYLPKGLLRGIFTNWPLQISGLMCYSLYLWHGNLRMYFVYDFNYVRILYYFIFLYAISWFTYRYIEFGNKKLKEIIPE